MIWWLLGYFLGFIASLVYEFIFREYKPEGGEKGILWLLCLLWFVMYPLIIAVWLMCRITDMLLELRKNYRGDE